MFGLGCRVCLEEPGSALRIQITHTEHPSTRPKEGNLEHQECAQGAKETQPVIPQGQIQCTQGEKAVTHITKIVFTGFINLHLYSCQWQVLVPHMEGTLGEAVFPYLFTILWKDIQSVNFQIKFEHYNEK